MLLVGSRQGFDALVEDIAREAARVSIEHPAGREFEGRAVLELGDRTVDATVFRRRDEKAGRVDEAVVLVFDTPLSDSDLESIIPATQRVAEVRVGVVSVTQRMFVPHDMGRTSKGSFPAPFGLRVSVLPLYAPSRAVSPEEIAAKWLGVSRPRMISAAEYDSVRNVAVLAQRSEKRPWEVDLLASQPPEIGTRWSRSFGKRPRLVEDALLLLCTPAAQQAADTLFEVLGPSPQLAAYGLTEFQARLGVAAMLAARKRDPAAVDFLREVEDSEIPVVLSPTDGVPLHELTNAAIQAVLITGDWVQDHPIDWSEVCLYLVTKVRDQAVSVIISRAFNLIGNLTTPRLRPPVNPEPPVSPTKPT